MLTLQIQDRGPSSVCCIEIMPAVVGSAEGVAVQLLASGVLPRHARFEVVDGVPQVVALGGSTVLVNGRTVRRAPLLSGDRIEVGAAVMVVRVQAAPAKLFTSREAPLPVRNSKQLRRRGNAAKLGLALTAAIAVVAIFVMPKLGFGRPEEFAEMEQLRRAGSFELAREVADKLRNEWVVDDPLRAAELDASLVRLQTLEIAVVERRTKLREYAVGHSDAQLRFVLQREQEQTDDETMRLAAGLVLRSLTEVVAGVDRNPVEKNIAGPFVAVNKAPTEQLPTAPAVPAAADSPAVLAVPDSLKSSVGIDVGFLLSEADRFASQGQIRFAIETLRAGIASANEVDTSTLLARMTAVTDQGMKLCDQIVAAARAQAETGQIAAAITTLEAAAQQLPSGGAFAPLGQTYLQLRNEQTLAARAARSGINKPGLAVVASEPVRGVTLQALALQLDKIQAAEAVGDFPLCESVLRAAAEMVKERDADYSARMLARATEYALLQDLHVAVAAQLQQGAKFPVTLQSGIGGELHAANGPALMVDVLGVDQRVMWLGLKPSSVALIAISGKLTGRAALGAAALLYRATEPSEAESVLAKALQADAGLKESVDRTIASGRGESFDPRGYTLGKDGKFSSSSQVEAEQAAQKVLLRLDATLRGKDTRAREQFTADLMRLPNGAHGLVGRAFGSQINKLVDQINALPLRKQLLRVAAQRKLIDDARTFAKELIYDEAKYFYPYKPPQVASDRYAEYVRVQAEVDARVAAVRVLWDDARFNLPIPARVQEDLQRIDWLASTMQGLGIAEALSLVNVAWARALPAAGPVTLKNYCSTILEREELDLWQRIEAYNEVLRKTEKSISPGEFELLAITNEYRGMFRHQPLALQINCCAAAHGHADEMSKLGYFSHFSPTMGRRSPSDRMKLAGYPGGASENIALVDGALSAHVAWLHSSGHHRNLLEAGHTEIGIGGIGRYWVQNFGAGRTYQEHPAWRALGKN